MLLVVTGVLTIRKEDNCEFLHLFALIIYEAVDPRKNFFKVGRSPSAQGVDILLVGVEGLALVGVNVVVVEESNDSLEGVDVCGFIAPKRFTNFQRADFDSLEGSATHGARSVETCNQDLPFVVNLGGVVSSSEANEVIFFHFDLELGV